MRYLVKKLMMGLLLKSGVAVASARHRRAHHHRVAGAIKAGIKTADLFVSTDMDEVGLIRIYARENAGSRVNSAGQKGAGPGPNTPERRPSPWDRSVML
jgi:hypothetical protein